MSEIRSKMYIGLRVKYRLLLLDCNETWIWSKDFLKTLKYQISWKSVQWELSSMWTDGRTDRHDKDNSRFSLFCERWLTIVMALWAGRQSRRVIMRVAYNNNIDWVEFYGYWAFCTVRKKESRIHKILCSRSLQKKLSTKRQFCENRPRDNHTLFKGVNKNRPAPSIFIGRFGRISIQRNSTLYRWSVASVARIFAVTGTLYWRP